ncbi:MAG: reprolysin-like metallopeptidase [Adhaeribacter sp.]
MKRSLTPASPAGLAGCLFLLLLSFLSFTLFAQDQTGLWTPAPAAAVSQTAKRHIVPQQYRLVRLQESLLRQVLYQAPKDTGRPLRQASSQITLPLAEGGLARFRFAEVALMEPALAARFPDIRAFSAIGIDHPGMTAVFELSPAGFRGMIYSPDKGLSFIDPYSPGERGHYMVYAKKDLLPSPDKMIREVGLLGENSPRARQVRDRVAQKRADRLASPGLASQEKPSGELLRTYRLALAATGEYTAFHGGTVPGALAAMVTTLNRVNFIFIRELSIRMVLVGNNDRVIYTDPVRDPYSNGEPFRMIDQVQADLDRRIGSDQYDIGHVFGTNSGGLAMLGAVCHPGLKAQGVTGSAAPVGDAFDVDYVAHEMGHQFGANHTFNGSEGACGPNRNPFTAYEPGSGSSIMAYSGLCGPQNLQVFSDAYFHTVSYDEIMAFSEAGIGNSCAQVSATGNTAPVPVLLTPSGLTIPKQTPFRISGQASDAEGDAITYSWEQYNLGPAGAPDAPEEDAPILRSFPASSQGTRSFPQLNDLLQNKTTLGELLPAYARSLHFNLTVRDNYVGGGGLSWVYPLTVHVSGTAGPFLLTFPNTNLSLPGGLPHTITWQVAGTDQAPVNCRRVNIRLSTDGGQTFPILLAEQVPNSGDARLTLPPIHTSLARIRLEAADHIFFDVSDTNFSIVPAGPQVLSFTLINARNNEALQPLHAGEVINLATLPSRRLNIRANTSPSEVGSVVLKLSGKVDRKQTENDPPYALFGDTRGEYAGWTPALGAYTLTATAYTRPDGGGEAGLPLQVSFRVVDQDPMPQLLGFSLINAKTNQVIRSLGPGEEIHLDQLPSGRISIRANTHPAKGGSVKFELSGQQSHQYLDEAAPYALFGDQKGHYQSWQPAAGSYTLRATPYSRPEGGGRAGNPLSLSFRISGPGKEPGQLALLGKQGQAAAPGLQVYPNPSLGRFRVRLPEGEEGEIRYRLLSLQGSKLSEGRQRPGGPGRELELDLSGAMQSPGVYYLLLEGVHGQKVVRLLRP